jgi:hypothetical protein
LGSPEPQSGSWRFGDARPGHCSALFRTCLGRKARPHAGAGRRLSREKLLPSKSVQALGMDSSATRETCTVISFSLGGVSLNSLLLGLPVHKTATYCCASAQSKVWSKAANPPWLSQRRHVEGTANANAEGPRRLTSRFANGCSTGTHWPQARASFFVKQMPKSYSLFSHLQLTLP